MTQETRGIAIRDRSGQAVFACGVAAEAAVRDALDGGWSALASGESPTLSTLVVGDRRFSAMRLPAGDAVALVLQEHADRDALFEFVAGVDFAADVFRHFLDDPYEAFVAVDKDGIIRYVSGVHERFFGLAQGTALGRYVADVLENTRLHEVVASGQAQIGHVQRIRGKTRIVNRKPIRSPDGRVVGAIGQLMFNGPEELRALSDEVGRLRSEVDFYKRELSGLRNRSYGLDQIVGSSVAVRRLKDDIVKVARLDVPVLIVGESGTGKELVAHAIHLLSPRAGKSMVTVNAAAMPATLVESELFGYEPGAFTGAERKGRKGKFEQADGGTLFFDEIGDMPMEIQVKLLRVLQDGSFERLGGARAERSDFRFISASNRDFQAMIDAGTFRLDLFYRISAVTLCLPPLRERVEDIPALAEHALRAFATRHGMPARTLSPEAVAFLQRQPWPGNVRQLMHTVERAAIFAESEQIGIEAFRPAAAPGTSEVRTPPSSVREAVDQVEEDLIRATMERLRGNKKRVAAELGISRSYLYKRLAELNLN